MIGARTSDKYIFLAVITISCSFLVAHSISFLLGGDSLNYYSPNSLVAEPPLYAVVFGFFQVIGVYGRYVE